MHYDVSKFPYENLAIQMTHHGKTQAQDHAISTDPDPKNACRVFFQDFRPIYLCMVYNYALEVAIFDRFTSNLVQIFLSTIACTS